MDVVLGGKVLRETSARSSVQFSTLARHENAKRSPLTCAVGRQPRMTSEEDATVTDACLEFAEQNTPISPPQCTLSRSFANRMSPVEDLVRVDLLV